MEKLPIWVRQQEHPHLTQNPLPVDKTQTGKQEEALALRVVTLGDAPSGKQWFPTELLGSF